MFNKLKEYKESAFKDIDETITKQAYNNVIKDLKAADIDPEELSDEEFKQLMAEEIKEIKTLGKGTIAGAGAFVLFDFLLG